jgi:hypothetical protein
MEADLLTYISAHGPCSVPGAGWYPEKILLTQVTMEVLDHTTFCICYMISQFLSLELWMSIKQPLHFHLMLR